MPFRLSHNYFRKARTTNRPNNQLESRASIAFYNWWAEYAGYKHIDQRLLMPSLNGMPMPGKYAGIARALGMRPGAPDYSLSMRRGQYTGLAIEMKVEGRKPTEEQLSMHERLKEQGWKVVVAHGPIEASDAVEAYLGMVEDTQVFTTPLLRPA